MFHPYTKEDCQEVYAVEDGSSTTAARLLGGSRWLGLGGSLVDPKKKKQYVPYILLDPTDGQKIPSPGARPANKTVKLPVGCLMRKKGLPPLAVA